MSCVCPRSGAIALMVVLVFRVMIAAVLAMPVAATTAQATPSQSYKHTAEVSSVQAAGSHSQHYSKSMVGGL